MSEAESPSYPIRGYIPGDEAAITELFLRSYGHPITEAHWRWKMKGYPTDTENVWLACDDGRPIFQYAGLPLRYQLDGQIRTGMVGADAMTDPDYRRRGLLTHVSRHAFRVWREAGVAFNIGLPNERWGSRRDALGWEPLFVLQWMVFPLQPEAILARRMKMPALKRVTFPGRVWKTIRGRRTPPGPEMQVHPATQADSTFDRIWEHVRTGYRFSIVRDRVWVAWRFLSSPNVAYRVSVACRNGEPVGYAAYRIAEQNGAVTGLIAEIVTARNDESAWNALADHILREMDEAGVEAVLTQVPLNSWQFRRFRHKGFWKGQHGFQVRMVLFDREFSWPALCDPDQWLMSGGDFDAL